MPAAANTGSSFGDDVETLTLDGKGHVTKYGDTWSIKATGPNSWESTTHAGRQSNVHVEVDRLGGWTNVYHDG